MSKTWQVSKPRRQTSTSRWLSAGPLVLGLMVSGLLQAADQGAKPPRQSGFHPAQQSRQMPAPPPGPYSAQQAETGDGQSRQAGPGYPPTQYRHQAMPPAGPAADRESSQYPAPNYAPPMMGRPDAQSRKGISREEFMARQAERREAMQERMQQGAQPYPGSAEQADMHEQRRQQHQEQMQARQERMQQQMQEQQERMREQMQQGQQMPQYDESNRGMAPPDWEQRQQMMQQRREQAQARHEQMRERMQEMQQRYPQPAPGQAYGGYRPMQDAGQSEQAQSRPEQEQQQSQAKQETQQQSAPQPQYGQPQYGQRQWRPPVPPAPRPAPYGYGYAPPAYGYGFPPPPPRYLPPQGRYPYAGSGADTQQQSSGAASDQ